MIMDIVIQLEDGSIADVEVQKIPYRFSGQRSACYSADLLLRQYKRVKGEKKKLFSYKDIKKVYTIVLYEKSGAEYHNFAQNISEEIYVHRFRQKSDTGLVLDLLQEYTFLCLDIFRKLVHNRGIRSRLEEKDREIAELKRQLEASGRSVSQ